MTSPGCPGRGRHAAWSLDLDHVGRLGSTNQEPSGRPGLDRCPGPPPGRRTTARSRRCSAAAARSGHVDLLGSARQEPRRGVLGEEDTRSGCGPDATDDLPPRRCASADLVPLNAPSPGHPGGRSRPSCRSLPRAAPPSPGGRFAADLVPVERAVGGVLRGTRPGLHLVAGRLTTSPVCTRSGRHRACRRGVLRVHGLASRAGRPPRWVQAADRSRRTTAHPRCTGSPPI